MDEEHSWYDPEISSIYDKDLSIPIHTSFRRFGDSAPCKEIVEAISPNRSRLSERRSKREVVTKDRCKSSLAMRDDDSEEPDDKPPPGKVSFLIFKFDRNSRK